MSDRLEDPGNVEAIYDHACDYFEREVSDEYSVIAHHFCKEFETGKQLWRFTLRTCNGNLKQVTVRDFTASQCPDVLGRLGLAD